MSKKISSTTEVTPIYDWFTGTEVEATQKVNPPSVSTDTSYYEDTLGVSQTQANVKKIVPQHPVLSPPNQIEFPNTTSLSKEMSQLVSQVNSPSNAVGTINSSDIEILRQLFDCLETQRKSRAESGKIAQDSLFKEQEVKKALHKKSHDVEDKAVQAAEISKVAGWINYALAGSLITTVLGSLIYGAFTGNISEAGKRLLNCVQGGLMISQGATSTVKACADYKEGQHTGELVVVKEKREESHKKIGTHVTHSKEAQERINDLIKLRDRAQKNWAEACHIQV
jgi:hypothetical protein